MASELCKKHRFGYEPLRVIELDVAGKNCVLCLVEEIKQLQAELDKHRWIPVSERLPEKNGLYLAGDKTTAGEAYWTGGGGVGKWKFTGTTCEFIFDTSIVITNRFPTHWKPIILLETDGAGKSTEAQKGEEWLS